MFSRYLTSLLLPPRSVYFTRRPSVCLSVCLSVWLCVSNFT